MKIIKECSNCSKFKECKNKLIKNNENCWDLSIDYFLSIMDKIPKDIKENFLNNQNFSGDNLVEQLNLGCK